MVLQRLEMCLELWRIFMKFAVVLVEAVGCVINHANSSLPMDHSYLISSTPYVEAAGSRIFMERQIFNIVEIHIVIHFSEAEPMESFFSPSNISFTKCFDQIQWRMKFQRVYIFPEEGNLIKLLHEGFQLEEKKAANNTADYNPPAGKWSSDG